MNGDIDAFLKVFQTNSSLTHLGVTFAVELSTFEYLSDDGSIQCVKVDSMVDCRENL